MLLIDGGAQKRCFTDVAEGIDCLFRIIENEGGRCDGKIFNIGNPDNEASIRELAELLARSFERHPLRDRFPPFAGIRDDREQVVLRRRLPGRHAPAAEHQERDAAARLEARDPARGVDRAHARLLPARSLGARRSAGAGCAAGKADGARRAGAAPMTSASALRVDVDTFRGTRDGVPRLLETFAAHGVTRDVLLHGRPRQHGPALCRRLCGRRFFAKMLRSRAASLYGWDMLLAGTLWPGKKIGAALGATTAQPRPRRATRSACTRGITTAGRPALEHGRVAELAREIARGVGRARRRARPPRRTARPRPAGSATSACSKPRRRSASATTATAAARNIFVPSVRAAGSCAPQIPDHAADLRRSRRPRRRDRRRTTTTGCSRASSPRASTC